MKYRQQSGSVTTVTLRGYTNAKTQELDHLLELSVRVHYLRGQWVGREYTCFWEPQLPTLTYRRVLEWEDS